MSSSASRTSWTRAAVAAGDPGRSAVEPDLLRPARHRQDHPGAGHRQHHRGSLHQPQRRALGRQGHPRGGGRGAAAARFPGAPDHPLHRRGSPLQQGPAGCAPPVGRGRHRDSSMGATTENPYFEVNKALVSRSLACSGWSRTGAAAENCARWSSAAHRPTSSGGSGVADISARRARGSRAPGRTSPTEMPAPCSTPSSSPSRPRHADPQGAVVVHIARDVAEESIQRRAVLYDREGRRPLRHHQRVHQERSAAPIPDAALYWLARMVYAGEDPRFIFRRMIVFASGGRRPGRPGGAGRGGGGGRRRSTTWACPRAASRCRRRCCTWPPLPRATAPWASSTRSRRSTGSAKGRCLPTSRTATATARGSGTGRATSTRTPTGTTGWRSSTSRRRCRAGCSTSRASRGASAPFATRC